MILPIWALESLASSTFIVALEMPKKSFGRHRILHRILHTQSQPLGRGSNLKHLIIEHLEWEKRTGHAEWDFPPLWGTKSPTARVRLFEQILVVFGARIVMDDCARCAERGKSHRFPSVQLREGSDGIFAPGVIFRETMHAKIGVRFLVVDEQEWAFESYL